MEKGVSLVSMNKTRWNSMHSMLQSVVKAEENNLIDQLIPLTKKETPKKYEINMIREICEVLEPLS